MKKSQETPSGTARLVPPALIVQIVTGLLALAIIWLGVRFARQERQGRAAAAGAKLGALAAVATDDIARALFGARDALRLLSRLPVLRESRCAGFLGERVDGARRLAAELTGVIEHGLGLLRERAEMFQQDLVIWLDLSTALVRLWFHEQGTLDLADPWVSAGESWMASFLGVRGSLYAPAVDPRVRTLRADAELARELGDLARGWAALLVGPASLLDTAFALGPAALADPLEAERLLAVSLNDRDLIRSVTVRDLSGRGLVSATEIGEEIDLFTGWLGRAARANRSVYVGPVTFDEGLGRPLWQMAVPLRDSGRLVFGLLTARIDLGFLRELAGKAGFSEGAHLLVVDEDGVVIGHPRPFMIVNQVNAGKANPAVKAALRGEEGVEELRVGGIPHVVAYRSLKKLDQASLPGWGVLVLAPVQEVLPSGFAAGFLAVAVAGGALFVLLYGSTMILSWVEDETGG